MKNDMGVLGVMVVGCGALGNEVLWNLGQAGVGEVLCVDPDTVEGRNLGLGRLFRPGQLGRSKADAVVDQLRQHFPRTRWEAFTGEVADVGWGRIARYGQLFGCVDRDSARLEMARIGTRLGLPVVDGGLGVRGRVSYFPGDVCFSCRLTAARRRELLATWRSQAFSCTLPPTGTAEATTLEQVRATGALAVELGLGPDPGAISVEISPEGRTEVRLVRSDACPFHEPAGELVAVPGTFRDACSDGLALSWEWPICLWARCQNCGDEWNPRRRRARVERCAKCGSTRILPLESVNEVEANSPWADVRPESIGLPKDHRYTVRVVPHPLASQANRS